MTDITHATGTPTEYMLTTVDNPYDPFTRFDEWFAWDMRAGYCTLGMLARIAMLSDEMSEPDQAQAIQDAIDEVIAENVSGMWKKITRDSADVYTA